MIIECRSLAENEIKNPDLRTTGPRVTQNNVFIRMIDFYAHVIALLKRELNHLHYTFINWFLFFSKKSNIFNIFTVQSN